MRWTEHFQVSMLESFSSLPSPLHCFLIFQEVTWTLSLNMSITISIIAAVIRLLLTATQTVCSLIALHCRFYLLFIICCPFRRISLVLPVSISVYSQLIFVLTVPVFTKSQAHNDKNLMIQLILKTDSNPIVHLLTEKYL